MLLGAHLSIAGGLCEALRAARKYRFAALALFVRNQRQWAAPPLADETATEFRALRKELSIGPVVAHGSYLLNLAGAPLIRQKSIDSLAEDVRRCGRLGIECLVIHPGSHEDAVEGVRLIAEGLREVLDAAGRPGTDPTFRVLDVAGKPGTDPIFRDGKWGQSLVFQSLVFQSLVFPTILLETTAGAGHSIGGRFEELAEILALAATPDRLGVCLDTCHVFAAGYDLRTPQAYAETIARFDAAIGLSRLKAVHLNDSLGDLGSRLDRHEHIGKGRIGLAGFANFARDERLANVPLLLETPKGKDPRGRDWDRVNAGAIRRLAR